MLMAFSGDMERQVGVPVTPVCDRSANTVAKIQIGEQNYTLIWDWGCLASQVVWIKNKPLVICVTLQFSSVQDGICALENTTYIRIGESE